MERNERSPDGLRPFPNHQCTKSNPIQNSVPALQTDLHCLTQDLERVRKLRDEYKDEVRYLRAQLKERDARIAELEKLLQTANGKRPLQTCNPEDDSNKINNDSLASQSVLALNSQQEDQRANKARSQNKGLGTRTSETLQHFLLRRSKDVEPTQLPEDIKKMALLRLITHQFRRTASDKPASNIASKDPVEHSCRDDFEMRCQHAESEVQSEQAYKEQQTFAIPEREILPSTLAHPPHRVRTVKSTASIAHNDRKRAQRGTSDVDAAVRPGYLCPHCLELWSHYKTKHDSSSLDLCISYGKLSTSSQSGCHQCTLVTHMIKTKLPLGLNETSELRLMLCESNLSIGFNDPMKSTVEISNLHIKEGHYHPCLNLPPAQLSLSNASQATFDLSLQWLDECRQKHTQCQQAAMQVVCPPTRLIDVEGDGTAKGLRLVYPSQDITLPYLTLSHCWGGAQIYKLVSSNHDYMQNGFSTDDLPVLFRDAVTVTRRLGFKYLWIESLCIRQDSLEDWKREAEHMDDVYRGCVCMIAALSAANSDQSMFTKHNPLLDIPCIVSYKPMQVGRYQHDHFDRDKPNVWLETHYSSRPRCSEPLYQRAWVVQERLLSPRVLEFTDEGVKWHCRRGDGISGSRGLISLRTLVSGPWRELLQCSTRPMTQDSRRTYEEHWFQIVKSYSSAKLTKETDRSVALNGVIRTLEEQHGVHFLAGVCRETLPFSLLWYYHAREIDPSRSDIKLPSWSCTFRPHKAGLHSPHYCKERTSVLSVSSTSMSITLKGPSVSVVLERLEKGGAPTFLIKEYGRTLKVNMDFEVQENRAAELLLVQSNDSDTYCCSLILARMQPGGQTWTRIGYFETEPSCITKEATFVKEFKHTKIFTLR